MQLAKQALDVGVYTNNLEPMLAFWQASVGLPLSEMLPLGGGLRQHRHAIGESVFKLNHSREPLPSAPPCGITALSVAAPGAAQELADPDGNRVNLVPPGFDGIEQMRVHLSCNDVDRSMGFYQEALGLQSATAESVKCGVTELAFTPGTVAPDPEQRAIGYRYMTMQIFDVVAAHAHVLANGGTEGMAPVRLGDVAYISFVRDPDGNWIELSQRKSIVGSLD